MEMKSAWASKINWTAAATAAISIGAVLGVELEPETQKTLLAVSGVIGPVLIIVLRTFFTKSITPASARKIK